MNRYTIIIPTRDRAETFRYTLRTCLRQTYPGLEIIVSDNCSSDDTHDIVKSLNDHRVRYINPGRRLSMSRNFEFALSHAQDGFIMIIGSDDGVLPGAIEQVESIVQQHGVLAVSCRQATYVWPDFQDRAIAGRLRFGSIRRDVEIRSSAEFIRRSLRFDDKYTFELPNLYCGFVHRRAIDRGMKDGTYFRSVTPDAYAAFAVAIHEPRYAFSHVPFVIAGASTKSNGASQMHPKIDNAEAEKFNSENDIPFHSDYVFAPSMEISAAEAFAQTAEAFPEVCLGLSVDRQRLLESTQRNANAKTRAAIQHAVQTMARNWGIDLDGLATSPTRYAALPRPGIIAKARALIHNPILGLDDACRFHVHNVDDAALLAGACMTMNNGVKPNSFRSLRWSKIRSRLGLSGSSDARP